jgi:hypothetical protein
MGDLTSTFPELKARIDRWRMEFLRVELSLSFTLVDLARTYYKMYKTELAERNFMNAEKGYSTLLRFLSDPKHSEHLPIDVQQELTTGMQRLRKTLDGLKNEQSANPIHP